MSGLTVVCPSCGQPLDRHGCTLSFEDSPAGERLIRHRCRAPEGPALGLKWCACEGPAKDWPRICPGSGDDRHFVRPHHEERLSKPWVPYDGPDEQAHAIAMKALDILMLENPARDSAAGVLLSGLGAAIEDYEQMRWPIGGGPRPAGPTRAAAMNERLRSAEAERDGWMNVASQLRTERDEAVGLLMTTEQMVIDETWLSRRDAFLLSLGGGPRPAEPTRAAAMRELHDSADRLLAMYSTEHPGARPSELSALDLLAWAAKEGYVRAIAGRSEMRRREEGDE